MSKQEAEREKKRERESEREAGRQNGLGTHLLQQMFKRIGAERRPVVRQGLLHNLRDLVGDLQPRIVDRVFQQRAQPAADGGLAVLPHEALCLVPAHQYGQLPQPLHLVREFLGVDLEDDVVPKDNSGIVGNIEYLGVGPAAPNAGVGCCGCVASASGSSITRQERG